MFYFLCCESFLGSVRAHLASGLIQVSFYILMAWLWWSLTALLISGITSSQAHFTLSWPKTLFGFFHKMVFRDH